MLDQTPVSGPLLSVSDLRVAFPSERGPVEAVRGVSFDLDAGETLAIVGESGCGKSATAMALLGLTRDARGARVSGSVRFQGRELVTMPEDELRRIRGAGIAMVFQDPMTSLNPVRRVGDLIAESIRAHLACSRRESHRRAVAALEEVGIPDPDRRAAAYPHELSGGMRQRVMIAMALACEPAVLIADEATTALDVTIQAQIVHLIRQLQKRRGTAVVLVSHDLGVVAGLADRTAVMYAGRIVEQGPTDELFATPRHPYTRGLLDCIPRLDRPRDERLRPIPGQPPPLVALPDGCAYRWRCPLVEQRCDHETPALAVRGPQPDHRDACLVSADVAA